MNKFNFLVFALIASCGDSGIQAMEETNKASNPPTPQVIINFDEETLIAALSKMNVTITGRSLQHWTPQDGLDKSRWNHSFIVTITKKK